MSKRHVVASLLSPDSMPFEFAVAAEVFGIDRSDLGVPWYEWKPCSVDSGPVSTFGGLTVQCPYGLDELVQADTVIVSPTSSRVFPESLLIALREAHKRGARIVSLCSGAFILSAAGLLDGRVATTHWMHAEELAKSCPNIKVDPAVLYIDDGDILTSAGTAASIDLCLYLVRKDLGAEVANAVARRMVVPPHRDGGQAQYVDHPVEDEGANELFAETLAWAESSLGESISVDEMARRSAMSPRTFARRFSATTGTTPHHWLTQQRVHQAQRLLESTNLTVERIASDCGFGSAANLRVHFQRTVKTSPTQYRRTFCMLEPETTTESAVP